MINYTFLRSHKWEKQCFDDERSRKADTGINIASRGYILSVLSRCDKLLVDAHCFQSSGECPNNADIAILMMVSPGYLSHQQMSLLLSEVADGIMAHTRSSSIVLPSIFVGVMTWGYSRNFTVQIPAPELLTP